MYARETDIVKNLHNTYPEYIYDRTLQSKMVADVKAGKDATEFICRNLGLICRMVDKYYYGTDKEDAVTEAIAVLLKSAKSYDKKQDTEFSTYATVAIMRAVQRKQNEDVCGLYVPVRYREMTDKYRADLEKYRDMTDEDVAKTFDISTNLVPYLRDAATLQTVSTDKTISTKSLLEKSDGTSTLGDFIPDERVDKEYETVLNRNVIESMMKRARLTDREKSVVEKRFYEQMTLNQVADVYNLTRERIRQIEKNALKKMKAVGEYWSEPLVHS